MNSTDTNIHPDKSIEIFLRADNGNGCRLQINSQTTLKQFKSSIRSDKFQLPSVFQLICAGKCLTEERFINQTFENLKIGNKSIIHIQNASPLSVKQLKINIWIFYQGEKFTITAKAEQPILSLKEKIYSVVSILPKNQLLVFQSEKLQDKQSISHYNIKNNSLICLKNEGPQIEQETLYKTNQSSFYVNRNNNVLYVNSVNFDDQKANKAFFNSQYYENRPVYQVEIKEEKNQTFSLDSLQQKNFNFDLLKPQICDLDKDAAIKKGLNRTKSAANQRQTKKAYLQSDLGIGLTESISPNFKLE